MIFTNLNNKMFQLSKFKQSLFTTSKVPKTSTSSVTGRTEATPIKNSKQALFSTKKQEKNSKSVTANTEASPMKPKKLDFSSLLKDLRNEKYTNVLIGKKHYSEEKVDFESVMKDQVDYTLDVYLIRENLLDTYREYFNKFKSV